MTSRAEASSRGQTSEHRLLVVDDEEAIRSAFGRYLRSRGFVVDTAGNGKEALALIQERRFSGMVCDVRMPEMTGVELVPKALAVDPDLAIVMLTAANDAETAADALTHGAMNYLTKPIELTELERAIERALRKRELGVEQRRVDEFIREEVAARTVDLEREKMRLRELAVGVANALITAMEAKDVYLRGRSDRVADLAASIANELDLDEDMIEEVRLAGRLHDVGFIGIRESVLNKPGPLTPEEFEHVKDHVRVGMEILSPLRHIGGALDHIQDHHEHWDGTGYPQGISGEVISIGGRILCAADAFDALTSQRAYRDSRTPQETIDYLASHSGTKFEPRIYEALRDVALRGKSRLVFIDDVKR